MNTSANEESVEVELAITILEHCIPGQGRRWVVRGSQREFPQEHEIARVGVVNGDVMVTHWHGRELANPLSGYRTRFDAIGEILYREWLCHGPIAVLDYAEAGALDQLVTPLAPPAGTVGNETTG